MDYQRSKHSVFLLNYHFIFVPKHRQKTLVGKIKDRLLELIQEYAKKFQATILAVEIMPDHVRLFLSVRPNVAPGQMAHYLKGWTSYILRKEFPFLRKFKAFWSPSYFVCSSGNVSSETIKKYIEESQHL